MSSGSGSLAAVTTGSEVSPCCCGCWSRFGNVIEGTFTFVQICGCFIVTQAGQPDRFFMPSNLVGVNGTWDFDAGAPDDPANTIWAKPAIGTIDLQEFDDGTCAGTPIGDPFTVDVNAQVNCFPESDGGLQALANIPFFDGTSANLVYQSDPLTFFQPSDVVPNVLQCDVDGLGRFLQAAAKGFFTVTPV